MSITKQVTVWCDGCGNWEQASSTAASLRRELKKKGWKTVLKHHIVTDYCPDCWRKQEEGYAPRA